MKYLKISVYGLVALFTIVGALIIRFVLIAQGWPLTNSDEATIGLMARHIAYQGEHPTFFYGQYYMGATEAYVAAFFFKFLGSSLFTLRFGLVLLFGLFLLSTYLLTRALYTRGLGLFTLVLLALGSSYVMARPLSAIGGYPETLLFGSLAFLMATWLVLSYDRQLPWRRQLWRLPGYFCWGLVSGLGLWSDLLILPFIACSGLLLVLCCWRELLRLFATISLLAGLVLGAYPLLRYNLHAAPGQDSLTVLLHLQNTGESHSLFGPQALKELMGTFQISLPMMTGNPFCPVTEIAFLGPTSPPSLQCTAIRSAWSGVYLLLFVCALAMAVWGFWKNRTFWRGGTIVDREKTVLESRKQLARLLLLGSGVLALVLYTFSSAPVTWPGIHARYLVGLLIVTPAVLWPLWSGVRLYRSQKKTSLTRARAYSSGLVLLLVASLFLLGAVFTFRDDLSVVGQAQRKQEALIEQLLRIGATTIYTDYWNCNTTAFLSNERIICGVVDGNLQPSHNRVPGYYERVKAEPRSAYVFHSAERMAGLKKKLSQPGARFRRFSSGDYEIYQPFP